MKRSRIVLAFSFVFSLMMAVASPTAAKTDNCALLKNESDSLLAQANQATADESQRLKDAAQFYLTPCEKTYSDDSLMSLWKYDATAPNELSRWLQYGLASKAWVVAGQGTDAYFQGTSPELPVGSNSGSLLKLNGFAVNNLVMYTYQGTDYPMYMITLDNRIRVLPLIKPARRTATFYDPSTDTLLQWTGYWLTLQPVIAPNVAFDLSFQVRLDTSESFFKTTIRNSTATGYFGVQLSSDGILIVNTQGNQVADQVTPISSLTPTIIPTVITTVVPKIGQWYSLRLLVQGDSLRVYLDKNLITEVPLDNFVMLKGISAGFVTSTAPATISLKTVEVKTNYASGQ